VQSCGQDAVTVLVIPRLTSSGLCYRAGRRFTLSPLSAVTVAHAQRPRTTFRWRALRDRAEGSRPIAPPRP
jgi:hypothetical protein